MKKRTDKEMVDFLEDQPLIGMVLIGRLALGKVPVNGAGTLRQAVWLLKAATRKGR